MRHAHASDCTSSSSSLPVLKHHTDTSFSAGIRTSCCRSSWCRSTMLVNFCRPRGRQAAQSMPVMAKSS